MHTVRLLTGLIKIANDNCYTVKYTYKYEDAREYDSLGMSDSIFYDVYDYGVGELEVVNGYWFAYVDYWGYKLNVSTWERAFFKIEIKRKP